MDYHHHPSFPMRAHMSITAEAYSGEIVSVRLVYDPDDPAAAAKVKPLLAALGAGYAGCVPCIKGHVPGFLKQRILLTWLAFSVAAQIGKWRKLPVSRNAERRAFLDSRLGATAASVVDPLYSDHEHGIEASYAAARELSDDEVGTAVEALVRAVFTSTSNADLVIDSQELWRIGPGDLSHVC